MMIIKASGRSALVLAAGLLVGFAGMSTVSAATDSASKSDSATAGKSVKPGARHGKRSAHRKTEKSASKAAESKADTQKAADTEVADAGPTLPASVANANAELVTDAPAGSASAMTAKANTLLAAADQPAATAPVAPSDQINDIDRALQPSQQVAQAAPVAAPQAEAVTAKPAPVMASSESTSLDQTSLIGKIFIAFGALLTMASAARMFMA